MVAHARCRLFKGLHLKLALSDGSGVSAGGGFIRLRAIRCANHHFEETVAMKWVTREHVKVDRVACPWLIRRFVDPEAEFLFVPGDAVMDTARNMGAIPYDVSGAELGHHGPRCSFEAIVEKYGLGGDPALALLARIVNGADTDNSLYSQAEGAGLKAVAEGFALLGLGDDHAIVRAESIVYDALYVWCKARTAV